MNVDNRLFSRFLKIVNLTEDAYLTRKRIVEELDEKIEASSAMRLIKDDVNAFLTIPIETELVLERYPESERVVFLQNFAEEHNLDLWELCDLYRHNECDADFLASFC